MKKVLSIVAALSLGTAVATAETFTYNFGTDTGTHSSGASTAFLPAAPSGTSRVRVGTGSGSFVLANPGDAAIGSGSELAITAATNTSVNKFSIHDYTGGTTGGLSFSVRFLAADTGTWQIFVGDGASFSDNNGFTSAQVAAGLQFAMQSSTTDITTSIRNGGSWTAGTSVDGEFVTGVTYRVDMFVNKSGSSANYTYTDTNLYSLANGAMDVWIDGTRHAGLATGALAASFDSFMVIGISSTSNESVIILDDIAYHNSFTSTLPVELDLFQID